MLKGSNYRSRKAWFKMANKEEKGPVDNPEASQPHRAQSVEPAADPYSALKRELQKKERSSVEAAGLTDNQLKDVQDRLYKMIEYTVKRHDWFVDQCHRLLQIGLALIATGGAIAAIFVKFENLPRTTQSAAWLFALSLFGTGLYLVYLYNSYLSGEHPYRKVVDIHSWYFPTKPSYLKRLVAFPDKPRKWTSRAEGLNQIEKISIELAKKPGFSNLSFVILRPADLYDQFRPGYVPCAIAGDFKFRDGKIDLNVMFRTSDALAVGYADIYYMRQLQMQVLGLAMELTKNAAFKRAEVGMLNMYLCRSYIQRTRTSKSGARMDGLKAAHAVIELIRDHQNARHQSP